MLRLLYLTDAKLQEDGSVKGLSEQIEKLAKAEDSKFLFEEAQTKPKLKGFQPGASSEKRNGTVRKNAAFSTVHAQTPHADYCS